MGKGDKKTKRGKIILGSYGTRRPRRSKTLAPLITIAKKVEKAKPEKPKAIKQSEAMPEPIVVAAKALEQPVVLEKKTAMPKIPKKTTAKTDKPKETPVK